MRFPPAGPRGKGTRGGPPITITYKIHGRPEVDREEAVAHEVLHLQPKDGTRLRPREAAGRDVRGRTGVRCLRKGRWVGRILGLQLRRRKGVEGKKREEKKRHLVISNFSKLVLGVAIRTRRLVNRPGGGKGGGWSNQAAGDQPDKPGYSSHGPTLGRGVA